VWTTFGRRSWPTFRCRLTISGPHRERALRVDLFAGYSVLFRIDAAGPCAFPSDLRRLWNLAPLEEELRSGWLLNGPFAVDPGRTGLAGSIADRQEKFQKLGRALGDRLLELHDLAEADWPLFANSLDLDASGTTARGIFWSHLFNVLALDFDDDLGRYLHPAVTDTGVSRGSAKSCRRACRRRLPHWCGHRRSDISPTAHCRTLPCSERFAAGRRWRSWGIGWSHPRWPDNWGNSDSAMHDRLDSYLRDHRQDESNIVIETRRDQAAAKRSTTRWIAVSAR